MNQIEIGIEPDNRNRTRIKLCGLTRPADVQAVNEWMPDYIGFVFAKKSRRYVSREQAAKLKNILHPGIRPLIKAFHMEETPIEEIRNSTTDLVLLDSGSGGTVQKERKKDDDKRKGTFWNTWRSVYS